jgi:hypothetical protein
MLNRTTTNIQTGRLFDSDGKNFDITVILNWPTYDDYESTTDIIGPNLVDFYFGDENENDTNYYVRQFVEKQANFRKLLDKLYSLKALCPDDTEIDEQIKFVKNQIVTVW